MDSQKVTIILRHDTSTQWIVHNPILALGEYGVEDDTHRIKRGDGVTPWSDLYYDNFGLENIISFENLKGEVIENEKLKEALDKKLDKEIFKDTADSVLGSLSIKSTEDGIAYLTKVSKNVTTGGNNTEKIKVISSDSSVQGKWSMGDNGVRNLDLTTYGAAFGIPEKYYFDTTEARDSYFESHEEELVNNLQVAIKMAPVTEPVTYYISRYKLGLQSWQNDLAVARGPKGDVGVSFIVTDSALAQDATTINITSLNPLPNNRNPLVGDIVISAPTNRYFSITALDDELKPTECTIKYKGVLQAGSCVVVTNKKLEQNTTNIQITDLKLPAENYVVKIGDIVISYNDNSMGCFGSVTYTNKDMCSVKYIANFATRYKALRGAVNTKADLDYIPKTELVNGDMYIVERDEEFDNITTAYKYNGEEFEYSNKFVIYAGSAPLYSFIPENEYKQNDMCVYKDGIYRAKQDFTSTNSFDNQNWTLVASLLAQDIKYTNESQSGVDTVKKSLDNLISNKLDKTKEVNKLYGTNESGEQKLYDIEDLIKVKTVNNKAPDEHKNITVSANDIKSDDTEDAQTIADVLKELVKTKTFEEYKTQTQKVLTQLQEEIQSLKKKGV